MADFSANKMDPDTHLMLEQPLLRLPHELLRKNLKSAQRQIEVTHKAVNTTLSGSSKSAEEALAAIDATLAKAQNLKRKLEGLQAEEQMMHKSQRTRIQHLQELHEMQDLADVRYERWSQIRLDRLLVDYMLRQGYTDAARQLSKENRIEELVDVEVFQEARKIENQLRNGEMKDALSWCNENKTALKKIQSELEMELRLQQFVEMRRQEPDDTGTDAIIYARKHLSGDQSSKFGLSASGLMAFPPDTYVEPYRSMYAPDRYMELAERFTWTFQRLLSLPTSPFLNTALSAGLSALKTPSCHSAHALSNTANTGAPVCPICSTELNELAKNVPYAHHTKSYIEDDPVVLPNGRVFGRERLKRLNEKLGTKPGLVRDPTNIGRGGTEWNDKEAKKVFIS